MKIEESELLELPPFQELNAGGKPTFIVKGSCSGWPST